MRKTIFSLLYLMAAIGAQAQSDTLSIGYCNGKVNTESSHKKNGKCWNNCALWLSKEALNSYEGNAIVGVKAGLVNVLNTDTLVVWVRKKKDGPNIAEAKVVRKTGTGNVAKGWNKLLFDQPLTLDTNQEGYYVGYSLRQRATVEAVSTVQPARIGTSFLQQGNGEWQDISSEGVLSIEALVAGSNMPDYDLGVASATIVPRPSVSTTALSLSVGVHNYGTKAAKGYTIALKAADVPTQTVHIAQSLPAMADTTLSLIVDPGVATHAQTQWTVELTASDGATDCNASNNTTVPYYTYVRNVLLEEFTTEKCSNCPTAAANLHTLLGDERFSANVMAVAHHVGYYTDWLTLSGEEELLRFYDNGNDTYAPAAMANRKAYFENNAGKSVPVFLPTDYELLEKVTATELQQSTNAMISVDLQMANNNSVVNVCVGGVCNELYNQASPRVTVYLVENDIKAQAQEGASGTYYQQHVTRAVNATWGEPVEWKDGAFSYNCSFTIDPTWNTKNMEVVAFVGNYDAGDVSNCAIENCAKATLPVGGSTAVKGINAADDVQTVARYTLSGAVAPRGYKGVTIIKLSDGSAAKQIIK